MVLDIVERTFGSAAVVQPEIVTLHQFFEELFAPLRGPRLIDENSRLVLLEGIVKERLTTRGLFGHKPDLLAPALSAALAKMIEQLAAADVGPDDLAGRTRGEAFSDKPQVVLLEAVYRAYEQQLADRNLTDPAGMRAFTRDHVDPAVLSRFTRIVVDGIHDASPIETELLKKTVAPRATCLVQATSPQFLAAAGSFHPLRIPKEFLAGLGGEPEPGAAGPGAEESYLASLLFSDKPFRESASTAVPPSFAKDIRVLSAVNAREEVSLIAAEVKQSLQHGAAPDSLLVAFPALDEYGPLAEEIFTDYGIPYNRALGRQLSSSPVTAAVVSLLRAGQEDFSGPSLLRVFSSPLLKFGALPALTPLLDRLLRDKQITGGRSKLLTGAGSLREHGADALAASFQDLFDALKPFLEKDAVPLRTWMERLAGLMAWAGVKERVNLIKGPLNSNLQALKKMEDTLASLGRAGALFPDYRYTFSEWFFLLKKTFMHTRFQVPPEDEGGVQILGLDESMGHAWNEVYLGGLIDGAFPQRLPQNIFLPEKTLEAMGVRTLEKARLHAAGHFYRLLLSSDRITLTYPENQGDRPVVPSPFLEELAPLRMAGLVNRGIEKTSGLQFSLRIEDCRSISELAKAVALEKDRRRLAGLLQADIDGMAGIKAALRDVPPGSPGTIAPRERRSFSVTELDLYLRCPYDYLVVKVLGLEPLEEVSEDLSPLDRGSAVHGILKKFYEQWTGPITPVTRNDARSLLHRLGTDAFGREADTFRNRREKDLFLSVMTERFLDGEEAAWQQGLKPAYLEHTIEHIPLVLSNGETVELSGKIDRIDVDADGNFVIVDYKTGKYPQPKLGKDQDIFQLPIYAVMALAQWGSGESGPALKKPIGLAYYDLAGKAGGGGRDVVLFDREARDDHPSSKPRASAKSAEEFAAILDECRDKARRAVEGILAGDFPNAPREENTCRYCPNEMMCERKET
jgi:ATP-dependent helicase/nuclease subunit B